MSPPPVPDQPRHDALERSVTSRLWRAGRTGWALLGLAGVFAVAAYVASLLSLLVVPAVLALFPATLLVPVASWLRRRGLPAALAALAALVGGILLVAGVIGAMVPLFVAEVPELAESASAGVGEIEQLLAREPLGLEIEGVSQLLETARDQVGEIGDLAPQAMSAAVAAFETVVGLLLMLVVLFFYVKDGRRISDGLVATAPATARTRAAEIAQRSWETLGAYFRGQLLVALVDAILIGAGLLIIGVPLAVPLGVLIFFGGLFPVVGAVVTGTLAVLVAVADAGLVAGLIVLALVLGVQQLEGNVLQPVILSRAIDLHPLVVLLSISAGAVLVGVLGAFLAVPVAAIVARAVDYLRYEAPAGAGEATGEGGDAGEDERRPGEDERPAGGRGAVRREASADVLTQRQARAR